MAHGDCGCSPAWRKPKTNGTCGTCGGWLPGERPAPLPWLRPTQTQEGEYARNQQEAVEHIRTLPPSERSAVANRPGQAPPSTQERP